MFRPRFLFNADGAGSGGGDGQAAGGSAGSTTTATGSGKQDPGQDGAGTQSGNDDQPTISQDQANRLLAAERRNALDKYAKELGLGGADDLKTIVQAKKQADDQAASDLDRANQAKAQAEQRAQQAETRAKNALLRAAFDRAGISQVEDLDSAFVVAGSLGLLGDESGLEIDLENARVSGMDKVIKKLIDQKPLFKKGNQAQPAGTGGAERGTTTSAQLTPEQEEAERKRRGIRPRRV